MDSENLSGENKETQVVGYERNYHHDFVRFDSDLNAFA